MMLPKKGFRQRGFVASGILELWSDAELVRMKHFYDKSNRKKIMAEWEKDLNRGDIERTGYYFIIKLD